MQLFQSFPAYPDLQLFLFIPLSLSQYIRRLSTCISFYPFSVYLYIFLSLLQYRYLYLSLSFVIPLYLLLSLVYQPLSHSIFFKSSPYEKELLVSIESVISSANKYWESNDFFAQILLDAILTNTSFLK